MTHFLSPTVVALCQALGLYSGLGRVDMSGAGGVFKLHLLARHLERLVARAHAARTPLERLVLLFVDRCALYA